MHNRSMTQTYPYRKNTSSRIDGDKSCSSTNYSNCVGGATTPRTRKNCDSCHYEYVSPSHLCRCSICCIQRRNREEGWRSESDGRNSRGTKTEEREERDRNRRRGEKSTRFRLSRLSPLFLPSYGVSQCYFWLHSFFFPFLLAPSFSLFLSFSFTVTVHIFAYTCTSWFHRMHFPRKV